MPGLKHLVRGLCSVRIGLGDPPLLYALLETGQLGKKVIEACEGVHGSSVGDGKLRKEETVQVNGCLRFRG